MEYSFTVAPGSYYPIVGSGSTTLTTPFPKFSFNGGTEKTTNQVLLNSNVYIYSDKWDPITVVAGNTYTLNWVIS